MVSQETLKEPDLPECVWKTKSTCFKLDKVGGGRGGGLPIYFAHNNVACGYNDYKVSEPHALN